MDNNLNILKSKLLDASHNFRGKSKESIIKNSTYDRKMLLDTVISLIGIADGLVVLNACDTPLDKLVELFADKTETMMKNLMQDAGLGKPVVNENQDIAKQHVLVVQNDSEDKFSSESWSSVVKEKISDKLKDIPVNKTLLNNDGKGCIFLPNESALVEADNMLSSELSVTKSTKVPAVLLPKICVHNIKPEEVSTSEILKEKILHKNSIIAQRLKDESQSRLEVLFVDKNKRKAILKVTPDIREIIMKTQRIFIDIESHYVSDSFHIEQCFQCQAFGHRSTSDRCPKKNSDPVCFFCAGTHRSSNCSNKNNKNKHKCVNCDKSNNGDIRNRAKTHNANSKSCPIFEREVEHIKMKTSYDIKNYETDEARA